MEDLIERMSSLPLEEKKILYNEIARLIRQDMVDKKEKEEEEMQRMKLLLFDILGFVDYIPSSRERKQVVFRIILSNLFLRMGRTEAEVGCVIQKDHSTIHHYRRMLEMWLSQPRYFEEELSYWNQINALI